MKRKYIAKKNFKLEHSFLSLRFIYIFGMSIVQLFFPILFIDNYASAGYGKWVVALSMVAFVNFADFGFLGVVVNKGIEATTRNDRSTAGNLMRNLVIFVFTTILLIIIFVIIICISLKIIFNKDIEFYLYILVLAACAQLILRTVEGIFRAFVSSTGFLIFVLSYFLESIVLICGVLMKVTFFELSMMLLGSRIAFCSYGLIKCIRLISMNNNLLFKKVSLWRFIKLNIGPGLYFLLLPLGYLILFDGSNLILGSYVSKEFVAALSLLRIATGVYRQLSSAILTSFNPSISQAIYGRKYIDLNILHKRMKKLLIVSVTLLSITYIFSLNFIYLHFLSKSSLISKELFIFFLITVIIDLPWNFRATFLIASNNHADLGKYFLLSSIISILLLYPLAINFSLYGVALAFSIQDIMLTRFVFKESNLILHKNIEVD